MKLGNHIGIILLFALSIGCTQDDPHSLSGKWWSQRGGHYTYWEITRANNVTVHLLREQTRHSLIEKNGEYFLKRIKYGHEEELGKIESKTENRIVFSKGLTLFRLVNKTKSEFTAKKYEQLLINTIWEYEFSDMTTRLYLTNDLTLFNFFSTSLVREGFLSTSSIQEPWSIKSYNGTFILIHGLNNFESISLELSAATDTSFSGFVHFWGEKLPVKGRKIQPMSKQELRLLETKLVDSEWETEGTKIYEFDQELPDSVTLDEPETLIMEWSRYNEKRTIRENEIKNNPFSFSFEKHGKFEISRYGIPSDTLNWHLTRDGKYLFFYHRRNDSNYLNTHSLFQDPPSIRFDMSFFIGDPENGVRQEYLTFDLEKIN